jgi:hypothetical protein
MSDAAEPDDEFSMADAVLSIPPEFTIARRLADLFIEYATDDGAVIIPSDVQFQSFIEAVVELEGRVIALERRDAGG